MRWRLAVMTLGLLPLVACSDAETPLAPAIGRRVRKTLGFSIAER